ncbi:MAG: transcription termination factor NusA [Candidatus Levybacteria bacterium RIFCSPHIGHO2_01_FULL_37_17]|nr:MAG: transcription termination factor NusA [Candidatus Levybacteria bacterium RIFCSPHIGHO2_01_FULL_37_17]OGH37029.1 MAG: transcription termination factor NusA [Candidatus Levybacteria bacterium RIFCSPLOWO2_01_FULL_38_23]
MPAIQRSEFALALNQVSNERGLDPEIILDAVRNAILAAYRKDHPEAGEMEDYTALLDANTGEAKILQGETDVTPPGFGRIAAQTAKQVILQKIREKEKESVMADFRQKVGSIVNGMVLRFAGPNVIVDIGKTEAIMPPVEQIQNEKYHLNQRLAVYVLNIAEGPRGEEVVVSRANNGLLEGLFRREVPEVSQGAVEIKAIVREPGNRSKVAVYSNQSGIDPVGSCVGQKGVRVQAIIAEFGGIEKIDIIQWQENIKNYIAASLSPAKDLRVEVNEDEQVAHVFVAAAELSLAIGKDGQNVRLASKLTGYRIEIEEDPTKAAVVPEAPKEEPKELKLEEKATTEEQIAQAVASDEPSEPVGEAQVEAHPESAPDANAAGAEDAGIAQAPTQETTETVEKTPIEKSGQDQTETKDEENLQ